MVKSMKSITFIAPRTKNKSAADISAVKTPLSGILILATMLHEKGYPVRCFDESYKIPNYEKIDTDIVLINTMSATANRAYELADFFKQKGKKVFIGGIHASFKPDEALQHCDKVVIGEGENVLFGLINEKFKKKIINGGNVSDLNSIPLPDYRLVDGMSHNPKVVSICSSRGCPFNCSFCSLKNIFGRRFRSISTDRIISYLQSFKKIKILCFDEPNFTVNKKRAIDILTQMKENSISPKYALPSVSIDIADDNKLLKLCSEVSEFNFLIGLESINQKVLNSFNKKQTPEKIKKSIKKIHDYGMGVQGSFIFGADHDDKTVFSKTVDFCNDTDIEFPIFCALTPYVGTDIRAEFEKQNRIFTDNWDYYDGSHVVFKPKNMSAYDLQMGVISSYEEFYSTKKAVSHLIRDKLLYSFETMFVRLLVKKIIKKNQDYLDYLESIC